MRGRLQTLGIYRESGHEHFNGSIVFPIFDSAGAVVEMYGRKITPNLREGTPDHLYLPGAHRGVWNEEALIASREIVLCEALIDALTFWVAGIRNVTASYGVNGFTDDHKRAFEKHGTERVYIAYDRDEAGDGAAAKLAEELIEMGIECFRVQFPKGMDANEYARKVTPAAKSLGVLLNKAEWLGKGQRAMGRVAPRVLEPVIVAEPVIEPEPAEAKAAAKGKKIEDELPEPDPIAATMPLPDAPTVAAPTEEVFSLAASPEPVAPTEPSAAPAPTIDVPVEMRGEDIFVQQGSRRYRIRGPSNPSGQYSTRLFGTHWCGPGGAGPTVNQLDAACQAHDQCYDANGFTPGSNWNPFQSPNQIQALQQCNQNLCNAAAQTNDPGSTRVALFFTQVVPVGACRPF
jgi:hypothetical protein